MTTPFSGQEASSPTPRLLMCPPSHFGVQYVINPWMEGQIAHTDSSLAVAQWSRLRDLLEENAQVLQMPPIAGLPDLVFTANAALIYRNVALLSSFRCAERQGEEPYYRAWLEANGFRILTLPPGVHFEGAGDALFDRGALNRGQSLLWAGHGFRSDLAAKPFLEAALGIEVQPLKLVDPRFYHLDTCFCPLTGGYLLYFAGAFDSASLAAIQSRIDADRRFAVPETDALQFSCNAVNLGQNIVTNHVGDTTLEWLRARSFRVTTTPMAEFIKAGGASKCLSLRLDEIPL